MAMRRRYSSNNRKSLDVATPEDVDINDKDSETHQDSVAEISADSVPSSANAVDSLPSTSDHFEFEFGGPIGTLVVVLALPFVIFGLYFACNKDVCVGTPAGFNEFMNQPQMPKRWQDMFSVAGIFMLVLWGSLQLLLERILPGEVVEGAPVAQDSSDAKPLRLPYVMSGHLQFWPFPLELIYDHYLSLSAGAIVFSFGLSVFLYLKSFKPGAILAKGGNSGFLTYDFFMGRELNPRIGSLDLKEFCELRPGLIGWLVINLGMLCKQKQKLGYTTLSMLMVTLSQGFYVWDALYQEKAILTTMDITTDGFGFMLAFGDLAWVPFTYTLQTRYLVDRDPHLPLARCLMCLAVQLLGYFIFRSANSQKDAFRRDPTAPEVAHLRYLQTKRGTKLITSGWWGAARKINYTGDWLITLSWCLLCGFDSPIPYFQAVYFMILLIHRALRDDQACAKKYGDDWDEYKRRVPYMFVPGVF